MVRPSLAKATLLVTPQRRWKTLVKQTDKDESVYYTLFDKRKDPNRPQPRKHQEPFQIDELLLDLDQYERVGVRTFTEQDEVNLQEKFRWSPRQTAVHNEIKNLRAQVKTAQYRMKSLMGRLVHPAQIQSHDVLSMALQGAPAEISTESQQLPEDWSPETLLERLRVENAIPEHAAKDESKLLEWMLRRHKQLRVFHEERLATQSPKERFWGSLKSLRQTLETATSVSGIRRSVTSFFALVSAHDLLALLEVSESMSSAVRAACLKALGNRERTADDSLHEALIFTGNLIERFERWKIATGQDYPTTGLHTLALRLSAMAGLVEITSEYLYRNFHQGIWDNRPNTIEDIVATLEAYAGCPPESLNSQSKQLLLQLMTGIDENGKLTTESFRQLVLRKGVTRARPAYITLLGRVGAQQTLLKEQHMGTFDDTAEAKAAFGKALEASVTDASEKTWQAQSLEECILEDYAAIV